jgi:UPF0271 protein
MPASERRIEALGDGAIRWPRREGVCARAVLERLRAWARVIDVVVTETHVCVTFDPDAPPDAPWDVSAARAEATAPKVVTIGVRYDGPDLADVAARCGLSIDEVVRRHARATYDVTMIGFLPGFAYLGPLDPALVLPRRSVPRPRIAAGAIGIAAAYTGIYPFASPGGWNLIGTACDFAPFTAANGAALALGDRVRFEAVT